MNQETLLVCESINEIDHLIINYFYSLLVFKISQIVYPIFEPKRPYYVNLAYLYRDILDNLRSIAEKYFVETFLQKMILYKMDYSNIMDVTLMQNNYLKYVEKFGVEKNLPGFLLTNHQMLYMIYYQSKCTKMDGGIISTFTLPTNNVFNCLIEETNDKDGEYIEYKKEDIKNLFGAHIRNIGEKENEERVENEGK